MKKEWKYEPIMLDSGGKFLIYGALIFDFLAMIAQLLLWRFYHFWLLETVLTYNLVGLFSVAITFTF